MAPVEGLASLPPHEFAHPLYWQVIVQFLGIKVKNLEVNAKKSYIVSKITNKTRINTPTQLY
jgi:hypothetical protein